MTAAIRMTWVGRVLASFALLLAADAGLGAQAPTFEFSIRNMMRGPEVYGREPSTIRWAPDGQYVYFQWQPAGTDWREPLKPYRVRAQAGAAPEALTEAQADSAGPYIATGPLSPDRTKRAVEFRGDLYVQELGKRVTLRRLTETNAMESQPRFSADGRLVLFVRDNNAYSLDLSTGLTRQLTDLKSFDPAAAKPVLKGQRAALEADQLRLLDVIRDRAHTDSVRTADTKARASAIVKGVMLAAGERVQSVVVSPNGGAVLFTTTTAPADQRAGIVPNYVTASGYTEDIPNRTKVGDVQPQGRLGFQRLPQGDVQWLRPMATDSQATVAVVGWNVAGTKALVTTGARNFKTRQLVVVDGESGVLQPLVTQRDTAWVGGPCGFGCAGFYANDARVYFVTEDNGYAQLSSIAVDGTDRQPLTGNGQWEVYDVALAADRRHFYFHSSETSPYDRDLWMMPVTGGARTKLTRGIGGHQVVLAPDEQQMADVYSLSNRPPELVVGARGASGATLTTSPTAEWLAFKWLTPEIVSIPASDGAKVPARIYRPQEMGATPNGAAVIFVHGAGYMHNIHHYWSSYSREYMFHHYLASKGYVVLDLDYRASAGYGRDWRTAIYRWMGGRDLQDQVDGSKYLTAQYGITPERIGMYGGSYGGFMTLMALFTEPRYFGAGAALRSVTDWAHYNHQYTGQILNLPQTDSIAYRRSSPIFLAEGLDDPLLMLHGMVDTNVNFQDIVRLTQRLIELGKTDWALAPYPVEDHGFVRPSSWTDEYTRIFAHFEATIGANGRKAPKR